MDDTLDAPPQPAAPARRLKARDRHMTADPMVAARNRAKVLALASIVPVIMAVILRTGGILGHAYHYEALATLGPILFTVSVGVIAVAGWYTRIPDRFVPTIIMASMVLGAAGIASIYSQVPWDHMTALPVWSPIAVWVFFVSVVMTLPPLTILKWVLLGTATEIVAQIAFRSGLEMELPPTKVLALHMGPAIMAPVGAAVVSFFTARTQRSLERAQEVGTYELTDLLGKGGMGEVWRAQHLMLKRPAAVKLIHPRLTGPEGDGERASKRFAKEAQATAALQSPHTIEVYDFGTTDDGDFYYVMELLDGIDLDTLVERFGAQPPARVAAILIQACHSLAEAHAAGLVRRDIKPPNIFLCRYGLDVDFVKVLDFGLVKETRMPADGTRLTIAGAVSGTPAYMAPEQVMSEDIDGRTDVYLLGCVAWYLLVGRDVYEGNVATQVMFAHLQSEPERPSVAAERTIHPGLEDVVMACLAKKPGDRPAGAQALAERLRALAFDEPWTEARARSWWAERLPSTTGGAANAAARGATTARVEPRSRATSRGAGKY